MFTPVAQSAGSCVQGSVSPWPCLNAQETFPNGGGKKSNACSSNGQIVACKAYGTEGPFLNGYNRFGVFLYNSCGSSSPSNCNPSGCGLLCVASLDPLDTGTAVALVSSGGEVIVAGDHSIVRFDQNGNAGNRSSGSAANRASYAYINGNPNPLSSSSSNTGWITCFDPTTNDWPCNLGGIYTMYQPSGTGLGAGTPQSPQHPGPCRFPSRSPWPPCSPPRGHGWRADLRDPHVREWRNNGLRQRDRGDCSVSRSLRLSRHVERNARCRRFPWRHRHYLQGSRRAVVLLRDQQQRHAPSAPGSTT
jgi:hypothetical protein